METAEVKQRKGVGVERVDGLMNGGRKERKGEKSITSGVMGERQNRCMKVCVCKFI